MEKTLDELLHAKREKISQQHANVGGGKSNPPRRKKHVHSLEVVCRKSLYGMFVDPHVFIKATLRDPGDCSRLAAILEVGFITMRLMKPNIFKGRASGRYHDADVRVAYPIPAAVHIGLQHTANGVDASHQRRQGACYVSNCQLFGEVLIVLKISFARLCHPTSPFSRPRS
jgi:hypothetical protein